MPIHITAKDLGTTEEIDIEVICTHPDAYIEKACCSGMGLIECGCGGRDSVVCPNIFCPGIEDHEVDQLFDRLAGGEEVDLT